MKRHPCLKSSTYLSHWVGMVVRVVNTCLNWTLNSESLTQILLRKTFSDTIFQEETNENSDTLYSVLVSGIAKTLLFIHWKTVGCISIILLCNVIVKCLESLSWWKTVDKWKTSCSFLSNNCRFRVWKWFLLNSTFPVWEGTLKKVFICEFCESIVY